MGKILSCPKRQTLTREEMRRRRLERYEQEESHEELNEVNKSVILTEKQKTSADSLPQSPSEKDSGSPVLEEGQQKESIVNPEVLESPKLSKPNHSDNSTTTNKKGEALTQEEIRRRRVEQYEEQKESTINPEEPQKLPESLPKPKPHHSDNSSSINKKGDNLTQEEIRRRRVELFEQQASNQEVNEVKELVIKKVPSQPPDHILKHPVYRDYGSKDYLMHNVFEEIFLFTIYEESKQEKPHLKLLSLDNPTQEGEEENHQKISRFTMLNFHQIIQKVIKSNDYYQKEDKLTFLYDTFNRLQSHEWVDHLNDKDRDELSKTIISYVVNFLGLPKAYSANMPQEKGDDFFDCSSDLYTALYMHLRSFNREKFLEYLILNIPDEYLSMILKPLLKRIIKDCQKITTENTRDFMEAIDLFENLLHLDKRVIEFFVNHKFFLPKGKNLTGINFQKLSIFGACLSFTTLPIESTSDRAYFYDKQSTKTNTIIDRRIDMLRSQIHIAIDCVHRMMEHMIKADPKYKRNILDWFYQGLLLNNTRQRETNKNTQIATDGWFLNFTLLLLKFCEKVISDTSKYPDWLGKIDLNFVKGKELWKDCRLLNGKMMNTAPTTTETSDPQKEPNFLTELIFYANHALFLHKDLNEFYLEFIKKLHETHRARGPQHETYQDLFAKSVAYECQLQDPYLFTHIARLFTFNVLLILHSYGIEVNDMTDIEELFEQTKNLKNEKFQDKPSLPFYWAENLHDYMSIIRTFSPGTFTKNKQHFEICLNFILSVGKNSTWFAHPYLKSKYLKFLGSLLPTKNPTPKTKDESFRFLFKENPYFEKYLIEGLVVMFVEVEKTGTHAQFYEKFGHRLYCCLIINYLLTTVFPHGKTSYVAKAFYKMTKTSYDMYLRFVMIYLNDIICLLDEGFAALKKVKAYQENTDVPNVNALTEEEKKTREKNYQGNKGMVQYFNILLAEYYQMGACVTRVSPDFFLTPEIRDKFIDNLNHSLQSLNGKKAASDIKVHNMVELKFDPKLLLKNIVQIYMNFSDNEDFMRGVVNDERSFDMELFHETSRLLKKYTIFDPEDMQPFEDLIVQLEAKAQDKVDEDKFIKELTDIPEEFYDPITTELMKDPVMLPSSKNIVDRLTIMKHLLSDENDPFNRARLTKEMLIPQPELKQKMQDYFKEKRESRKQK